MFYVIALLLAVFIVYKVIEPVFGFDFIELIMGLFLGGVLFFMLGLGVIGLSFIPDVKYELVETKEIYALKDNQGMRGNFYLGTGYVEDNQKYFFIVNQEGGKKMDSVSVDQSILYEGAKTTKVEVYEPVIKGKVAKFLFTSTSPRDNKYKLYIPKDSITTEYKVDME